MPLFLSIRLSPAARLYRIAAPKGLTRLLENRIIHFRFFSVCLIRSSLTSKFKLIEYIELLVHSNGFRHGRLPLDIEDGSGKLIWSYKRVLILIDFRNRNIKKVSFGSGVAQSLNNYRSLLFLRDLNARCFPKPLGFRRLTGGVFSQETYVGNIPILNVAPAEDDKIFSELSDLYSDTKVIVKLGFVIKAALQRYTKIVPNSDRFHFCEIVSVIQKVISNSDVCVSRTHGDLTRRNLVAFNNTVSFFDLDRSEVIFAEFDFINYYIDCRIVDSSKTSYKDILTTLTGLLDNRQFIASLETFRKKCNICTLNNEFLAAIVYLFGVRSIAYNLSDSSFDSSRRLENWRALTIEFIRLLNSSLNNPPLKR